jgi:pimeloyl-ACP methyl ester carboxylesterase
VTENILTLSNGVSLEIDIDGPEEGRTIILLSGAGAPLQFWPDFFANTLVSAGYRVLRYCHRDTGLSDHFHEQYSAPELLEDMRLLMDKLNCESAHLIGHSMGGYLALLAMTDMPERVISGTVISAGPTSDQTLFGDYSMTQPDNAVWEVLMKNQPTGNLESDLSGWLTSWHFLNGDLPCDEKMAVNYTRSLYRGDRRNAKIAENHIYAMTTFPSRLPKALEMAEAPLLILHGEKDPLVPIDHGQALAKLIPRARFQKLERAGHMFFHKATWEHIAKSWKNFVQV